MDVSNPEHRKILEESLKDLRWMQSETRHNRDRLEAIEKDLQTVYAAGKFTELDYQLKKQSIERSREDIRETLKMLQRQRTLILSWLYNKIDG